MSTSYSQTDLDSILQEQSEQFQQQVCAEKGEVFNEQTQICESIATTETTETTPTSTEDTNGDGVV
jgi:hypothetical protein